MKTKFEKRLDDRMCVETNIHKYNEYNKVDSYESEQQMSLFKAIKILIKWWFSYGSGVDDFNVIAFRKYIIMKKNQELKK